MSWVEGKLYTLEEFEAFANRAENAERHFELIDGEIVEHPATERHSLITGNFYAALREFVRPRRLGRVLFEARHRALGDERNARLPDVSFTRAERLLPIVDEGTIPLIPDVCIEVQSPSDSPRKLRDKAAYYLAHGARLVLIAYPKKRLIEAQYPDGEFDIFRDGEQVTLGEVLPGLTLSVSSLFEEE